MAKKPAPIVSPCPCGSEKGYQACCAIHHQSIAAPTAEALMRSRYSAYVLKLEDYLLQTWHPGTRPTSLDLPTEDQMKWMGLEIKRHELQDESHALVEFIARYKMNGKAEKLQETSRFVRINDRWLYLDGELAAD